jgi:hypothetical protein
MVLRNWAFSLKKRYAVALIIAMVLSGREFGILTEMKDLKIQIYCTITFLLTQLFPRRKYFTCANLSGTLLSP